LACHLPHLNFSQSNHFAAHKFDQKETMKKMNYISIALAFLCFAGAVGATNLSLQDPIPSTDQLISYLNQAHIQEQAY